MGDAESPPDRRAAILKAARLCFLDRGFVRTSISDIVAIAGGSRATVYESFGSKEGLFAALIASILEQMQLPDIASGPPDTVLREVGASYMEQLMDPEALALYRVAVGESAHVRQLGEMIFKAGPDAGAEGLRERLLKWAGEGRVQVDDPGRAARLFLAMVEGDLHRSAVIWNRAPSNDEIAANVDAAVALFLAGVRPATAAAEGFTQKLPSLGRGGVRECRKTQKAPVPNGTGAFYKNCSAASYSPTGSPLQYHRRCKA